MAQSVDLIGHGPDLGQVAEVADHQFGPAVDQVAGRAPAELTAHVRDDLVTLIQ